MNLILASQSPRRRELMALFGKPFSVQSPRIDETMDRHGDPAREVAKVSFRKASAVDAGPEDIVVAADTIVVCSGMVRGKPGSPQDAERMLALLSGRDHQVMTGLTVKVGQRCITSTEITHVYFRELTRKEILGYIATGEPMDKAGAYGIQGGAALFTERIDGDYYNVMGLPVCRLSKLLQNLAPEWMEDGK